MPNYDVDALRFTVLEQKKRLERLEAIISKVMYCDVLANLRATQELCDLYNEVRDRQIQEAYPDKG